MVKVCVKNYLKNIDYREDYLERYSLEHFEFEPEEIEDDENDI